MMSLNDILIFLYQIFGPKYDWDYYYNLCKTLPESEYPKCLKEIYKIKLGRELNLENPKRFTEKLQYIKLYDKNPMRGVLSDKLQVRDWVKSQIGKEYLPEIYGIFNSYDEIDFSILPDYFMFKSNHGSGMNLPVCDKKSFLNKGQNIAREACKRWLATNFTFACGFELQYKNLTPAIFIEEKINKSDRTEIPEYLFYCFNGEPYCIQCNVLKPFKSKFSQSCMYNLNWQKLPMTNSFRYYKGDIPKPEGLMQMINVAKKLSSGFNFVRVDLREYNNKIYFGEMTFTPYSGFMYFYPDKYDKIFGNMISLEGLKDNLISEPDSNRVLN